MGVDEVECIDLVSESESDERQVAGTTGDVYQDSAAVPTSAAAPTTEYQQEAAEAEAQPHLVELTSCHSVNHQQVLSIKQPAAASPQAFQPEGAPATPVSNSGAAPVTSPPVTSPPCSSNQQAGSAAEPTAAAELTLSRPLRKLVVDVLQGPNGFAAHITVNGVRQAVAAAAGRRLTGLERLAIKQLCKDYVQELARQARRQSLSQELSGSQGLLSDVTLGQLTLLDITTIGGTPAHCASGRARSKQGKSKQGYQQASQQQQQKPAVAAAVRKQHQVQQVQQQAQQQVSPQYKEEEYQHQPLPKRSEAAKGGKLSRGGKQHSQPPQQQRQRQQLLEECFALHQGSRKVPACSSGAAATEQSKQQHLVQHDEPSLSCALQQQDPQEDIQQQQQAYMSQLQVPASPATVLGGGFAERRPQIFHCPQQQQQQRQQQHDPLSEMFRVWPTATLKDLLPNTCSLGTVAFMDELIRATQPPPGYAIKGLKHLQAAGASRKRGKPRKGSCRRGPKKAGKAAGAAAAALATVHGQVLAAAAPAAAGSGSLQLRCGSTERTHGHQSILIQQQQQQSRQKWPLVAWEEEQRQLQLYGFCWRNSSSSSNARQLVVLGDLHGADCHLSAGAEQQQQQHEQPIVRQMFRCLDDVYGAQVTAPCHSTEYAAAISAALQQALEDLSTAPPAGHMVSRSSPPSTPSTNTHEHDDDANEQTDCQQDGGGGGSDEEFYAAAGAGMCSAASAVGGDGGCSAATGDAAGAAAAGRSSGTVAGGGCQLLYSMPDAPARRFYDVNWQELGDNLAVVLRPVRLMTRRQLPAVIRRLNLLTRVEKVTDPCHPCLHNPIEPVLGGLQQQQPPPGAAATVEPLAESSLTQQQQQQQQQQQPGAAATVEPLAESSLTQQQQQQGCSWARDPLMVVAAEDLPADQLLGLYWGEVITSEEDSARSAADVSCAYGVRHAYTMDVEWSEVQRLVECPGHSLVVVGDAEQCRMALVNDSKHWVEEMGTCPRLATGCCTCSRYTSRQPNVRYEHLLYRASDGSYLPALAVFTNTTIPAGNELLARYCMGGGADDSFWVVIRNNIRQYNYIRALQLQNESLAAQMQMIQAAAQKAASTIADAVQHSELWRPAGFAFGDRSLPQQRVQREQNSQSHQQHHNLQQQQQQQQWSPQQQLRCKTPPADGGLEAGPQMALHLSQLLSDIAHYARHFAFSASISNAGA